MKDASPRKMNQGLCPLSDFTPWSGNSRIRLSRKKLSLVVENTMKEVVRKLTAPGERKQIAVESKWAGVLLVLPST